MHKYGSIDYARKAAHKYALKAKREFQKIRFKNKKAASKMKMITDYVVEREV